MFKIALHMSKAIWGFNQVPTNPPPPLPPSFSSLKVNLPTLAYKLGVECPGYAM